MKKLDYEYVRNYIESKGCRLITSEYINASNKLEIECSCKRKYFVSFNSFYSANQCTCQECSKDRQAKSLLITYDYVRSYVEESGDGDKLIENSFVSTDKKMTILCSKCKKEYNTFWNNYLAGSRCKKCSMEKLWDKSRNSKKDIIDLVKRAGYILIKDFEHKNNLTKIDIQDKENYKYNISVNGFQIMLEKNKSLNRFHSGNKYTIENINTWLKKENRGCSIIGGNYTRFKHKNLIAKCDNSDHIYNTSLGILWACKYSGCLICASEMTESKIASYLKKYCNDCFGNDAISEYKLMKNPKTGYSLRNDIYIQSLCLHIEIMGSQHYIENKKFYKTHDNFLYQQYRDNIKKEEVERLGHNYLEIDLRKIKKIEESKNILDSYISQIIESLRKEEF